MKRYLKNSPYVAEYVRRAKGRMQHILDERGLSHSDLGALTGIHRTTIQRWLSLSNDSFMALSDAALIGTHLGLSVQAMLPDPCWQCSESDERSALMRRAEVMRTEHLRSLLECYAVITGVRAG
ncbi:hypothetical protein SAMN05880558_11349 [Aeromonas sp. RU39B]|uniref:helix-turn-helix domain-containing protein n=1 Tax=Aeromonas sp. RU39B TaxID=1907416 RepID=UPI000953C5E3|nr:helix-turn-helix transcriptional regulator [Aeromonas sp. RU39B]SIR40704.1 hypothetical protein SAMN05880558_11349 [Aeromonas sp. RU39B]